MNDLFRCLRFRVATVALLLSFTLGVDSTQVLAAEATPTGKSAVTRVAIVAPASRTDQGWNQQATEHINLVGEEHGFEVEVAENAGYDDITPILRDLADGGVDLIICHASGYQTVCPEFAAETRTRVAVIENPNAVEAGVVSDIETQAQEVAFLAGIVAGLTTRTGTVGIVVSGEP
ncbi:MAG: BMP family ABC transporter substrate-binding protein, partial [Chloroflexota bacterium]|nr:BMP family ABC transporter substrate-binding protein [Chloroflexota bacterium]